TSRPSPSHKETNRGYRPPKSAPSIVAAVAGNIGTRSSGHELIGEHVPTRRKSDQAQLFSDRRLIYHGHHDRLASVPTPDVRRRGGGSSVRGILATGIMFREGHCEDQAST